MADYIDRELVLKEFDEGYIYNTHSNELRRKRLESIPAADVVSVVRCKDCIYANDGGTICRYGVGRDTRPMGYCDIGESRGEQDG